MSSGQHAARKRFGQNFLIDKQITARIIQAIRPLDGELIVEIGPGQAALSLPLLDSGADVHMVEIDRDLAASLQLRFADRTNAHVHAVDALSLDFSTLGQGRPLRLVGNLPYNISTPLLFHLLKWSVLIDDMHFMLQREVVERMAASPGGKTWGRLSIMCQLHCAVVPLFSVPPEAFSPRPRVHSGLVRLLPHARPPVEIESMENFQLVVSRAFSMRRKTLRNSLRGLLEAHQIESAGIDPGLRPEMLGLEQFAALAGLLN